jgi:hypothetical protein
MDLHGENSKRSENDGCKKRKSHTRSENIELQCQAHGHLHLVMSRDVSANSAPTQAVSTLRRINYDKPLNKLAK